MYPFFKDKFRICEIIPIKSNNPEVPKIIYAVLEILDDKITLESISEEWIGRFVWLMQEARAKAF